MQNRVDSTCRRPRVAWLALALALAGCAAPDTTQPTGKLSDVFATPDWAKFTSSSRPVARRAVTSEDLITADGRCANIAEPSSTDGAATAPESTSEAIAGQGALPALQTGVALSMTECQVVQRTGSPDRFDIGAEAGERVTTMTITRGTSPGLYRFRGGRLVSIERIDVPAPARPVKAAKAKKAPAKTARELRGSQQ